MFQEIERFACTLVIFLELPTPRGIDIKPHTEPVSICHPLEIARNRSRAFAGRYKGRWQDSPVVGSKRPRFHPLQTISDRRSQRATNRA